MHPAPRQQAKTFLNLQLMPYLCCCTTALVQEAEEMLSLQLAQAGAVQADANQLASAVEQAHSVMVQQLNNVHTQVAAFLHHRVSQLMLVLSNVSSNML